MPDTEKKPREKRGINIPNPAADGRRGVRDESSLYGDEGDSPKKRAKKKASKAKSAQKSASKIPMPKIAPKQKRRGTKNRQKRRSFWDLLSATGSDSVFKPLHLFGHEIRFWPLILLVAIILMGSGIMLSNSNLTIVEQKVTVVGLPEDMEGCRIIVLSDMNGRRFGDNQSLLLRTINSLKYDAIFCVGDMVGKSGNAQPFYEFLEGLKNPQKVYFICGDNDPGPFVKRVRSITGTLPQLVLEDWILGAMERGANYVDAPTSLKIKNSTLWISPATMLNLETVSTLESWQSQTEQEEDGVISGIAEDYATLPITSYRKEQMQKLYDVQRTMSASDVHISLSHEVPSDEFIYISEEHTTDVDRYMNTPELILSGHYCGGVWRLPLIGAFYIPDDTLPRDGWFPDQSRVSGLSTVGETQIFISGGLSTNGDLPLMPFRLFNPPEISVLTLTSTLPENMLGN